MSNQQPPSTASSDVAPPRSMRWVNAGVRQNSVVLERAIKEASTHETVTEIKVLFAGTMCEEFILVPLPALAPMNPVPLSSTRPQVWFQANAGNDWNATPAAITWQETVVDDLNGTRLMHGYAIYTETTAVGDVNRPVYEATHGQPCFGNVMVVKLTGNRNELADDVDDEDIPTIKQVLHSVLMSDRIKQGPVILAKKAKNAT